MIGWKLIRYRFAPIGIMLLIGWPITLVSTLRGQDSQKPQTTKQVIEELVTPYLKTHCSSCHGKEKQEAGLRVDQLDPDIPNSADVDAWNLIRLRLVTEEMPPKGSPRPPHGQSSRILNWLTVELTKANVELLMPRDFHLPNNGNKVDHDLLFSGEITGPAYTQSRIWRQSPYAYQALTSGELAKNVRGIAQPFSVLTAQDIKDYASGFSIDESTASQLMRNASLIVASQTRGEMKDGKWTVQGYPQPIKEFTRLFEAELPLTDEAKRIAISRQFEMILKRKPTEDEASRYSQLMDKAINDSGLVQGVRVALTAVLLTPEAVFRFELGTGKPDAHGRVLLSPRELAFAIGYALSDRMPDSQLIRWAAEGKLTTREDVAREIDRIFDDPKIPKPRIPRFFQEYFGYHRAEDVFKDAKLNPHHQAKVLVEDTRQLIQWVIDRDENVFEELLTTNKSFVNYQWDQKKKQARVSQGKKLVHTSYGLPRDWKWTSDQPIELPSEERAGILTQPSWLVTMSGNFDNHAILRGKWVREHLLGGTIPDLPITVDAQLPEEPHNTLRERMRVTREEYCWNCHRRMNPLGLTFETFDHFGRFRTSEKVLDIVATEKNIDSKGKPIGDILMAKALDASGVVDMVGDQRVEGKTRNAVEMLRKLAKTDRARQMFVRYAFRYFLGRNEKLSDSPTLIAADKAYLEAGGSFRALAKSLLTSDSFLYRMSESKDSTRPESNSNSEEK